MIVFQVLIDTIVFLTISTLIVLLLNYILIEEFRSLINKIKRVISNPQKVNKITQIKQLVYEYLFVD